MKKCHRCGVIHTASGFAGLALVGIQRFPDTDEPPTVLRNCPCGSTLAMPLDEPPPMRTAVIHPVLFARLKPASWHAASLRRFT